MPVALYLAATLAAPPSDKDAQKVVKTLIQSIQYKKDDLAAKQIAFNSMVAALMGPELAKTSDADKKELAAGLEAIVRKISFPKGRDMFAHLDAVLYDKVRADGERAKLKATVVVHRNYKKTEIVIDWVLAQEGAAWKVVDTEILGDSTVKGIRTDQIEPLLAEGGVPAVMAALRAKVAELAK